MKHLHTFESFLNESVDTMLYRLIGGGQFGGEPITNQNEPRPGQTIKGVFATPLRDAIDSMIEFCLEQGENENTGDPIVKNDMRVLLIQGIITRNPKSHEKSMHWEDSDADEVMVDSGKIQTILTIKEWESA